jgi:hypothetical protein
MKLKEGRRRCTEWKEGKGRRGRQRQDKREKLRKILMLVYLLSIAPCQAAYNFIESATASKHVSEKTSWSGLSLHKGDMLL